MGYHFWRIEVFIDSVPSGAVVHIDGRAIGRTPVTLDLPAGQHRIQLTHSHYEPENLILTVRHGDRLHRQVTLHEGTG
ncbi:MAG: PEGA domain-containing protein, partial [Pseudomonadales bacterium]